MKIIYVPQRADMVATYAFEGERITVTVDGETDVFDFTGMPNGQVMSFETDLPVCPLLEAWRTDGALTVRVLHWYGANAAPEEREIREVTV